MKKLLLLALFLVISLSSWSEKKPKIVDTKLNWVFSIKIGIRSGDENAVSQIAFKVKGQKGLWTSLHGFFHAFIRPDTLFKNYRIIEVRDFQKNKIDLPSHGKHRYLTVTKVDILRDLVFISTESLDKSFNDGQGFNLGKFEENVRKSYSIINKASGFCLNSWPYSLGGSIETFSDQLYLPANSNIRSYLYEAYGQLGIPNLSCSVVVNKAEKLFFGDSGSPIYYNDTVVAVAQGSFEDKRSWGVILSDSKLKTYNDLSVKEKEILDLAHSRCKNLGRHDNSKSGKDTSIRQEHTKEDELCYLVFKILNKKMIDSIMVCRDYPTIEDDQVVSYNYVKYIPSIAKFYIETKYYRDLEKAYRILISKERDYPEKYRKVRKKLSKYPLTRSYLNAVYQYHIYVQLDSGKSRLDSMNSAAQQLSYLFNSSLPARREIRNWRRQDFSAFDEFNNLLDMIRNASDYHEKDPSPIDPAGTESNKIRLTRCQKMLIKADSALTVGSDHQALYYYLESKKICPEIDKTDIIRSLQDKLVKDSLTKILGKYITDFANLKYKKSKLTNTMPLMEFIFKYNGEQALLTINYGQSDTDFRINSLYYSFPPGEAVYSGSIKALEVISDILIELDSVFPSIIDRSSYKLDLVGHADGLPYRGKLKYSQTHFGNTDIESQRACNESHTDCENMRLLIIADSEKKNKALAYLRALNAKLTLESNLKFLRNKQNSISFMTHPEKGGEMRKVEIRLGFKLKSSKIEKR